MDDVTPKFARESTEAWRFREALERIAYHEPQNDEIAEAMRQIARDALWPESVHIVRGTLEADGA